VDEVTQRDDPYLQPFATAVRAGVPFVMVSLATYTKIDPDHLAVFSPTVIDGMLRGDLGFDGVVISDALGATAVRSVRRARGDRLPSRAAT
jgi:beta-N-acetylhexosaminidase